MTAKEAESQPYSLFDVEQFIRFAEWASEEGWSFRTDTQMWARFSHVDRDELECYECKTTAELLAEWDKNQQQ